MLRKLVNKVSSSIAKTVRGIGNKISSMARAVKATIPKAVKAVKKANDKLQEKFDSFLNQLGEDEQVLLCGLERGNVWDEAWQFVKKAPFRLIDYGFRKLNKLVPKQPTAWEKFKGCLSDGFERIGKAVSDKNIPVVSDFVGAFTGVREGKKSTVASTIGSFFNGLVVDGAGGLVDGVATIVTDPVGTLEGINKILAYSDEVLPQVGNEIVEYTDKNLIHGTADTRAEFTGQFVFEVASWLTGAGEAKAGTKAATSIDDFAKATNKIDDYVKATNKVDDYAKATNKIDDYAKATNKVDDAGKATSKLPEDGVHIKNGKNKFDDFDPLTATNKQKGNFGEFKADDNLINNNTVKAKGYDLEPIGRNAPSSPDDKIVKGIDGLYKNNNTNSKTKYVIDEAKFGSSDLGKTKDGIQMSDDWIKGTKTGNDRILDAVGGDKKLAREIQKALDNGEVERVLSKIDSSGNVTTYRLDKNGKIIGPWP